MKKARLVFGYVICRRPSKDSSLLETIAIPCYSEDQQFWTMKELTGSYAALTDVQVARILPKGAIIIDRDSLKI